MVWIAPGTFQMGDANGEPDELPPHSVTLSRGYWMGRFEVTQGQYLAVVGTNPSAFSGDLSLPVENVTWHDATNFCARFTQQELLAGRLPAGYAHRLPTEAEWEYAARAGSTTYYSFGPRDLWPQLVNYAWLDLNSGGVTHPVGQKLPNAWGLYDVHGNVWEWVADWFEPYSSSAPLVDPTGPSNGTWRVLKSSGYTGNIDHCHTADRSWTQPEGHYSTVGFRVALAVAPPTLSGPAYTAGQFQFTLNGQANVTYIIQSSTNLQNWTAVATNTSAAATRPISISAPATRNFYRAVASQ